MILDALRLVVVGALLVVLPGWLLVSALFPRRASLRPLERAYFTLAGGILLLMLIASLLGFLPHGGGRGHLQSLAVGGLPNVELLTLGASFVLFLVGLRRGAHQRLIERYPMLLKIVPEGARPPPRAPAP